MNARRIQYSSRTLPGVSFSEFLLLTTSSS
jgi:hypothetical protein